MPLSFYNTLTRQFEPFVPKHAGQAAMYTCGPTVYNYAHIGNYRAYVFEDILRRVLRFSGYQVTQVMNLTDVDDKTIRDSQKAGLGLNEFTAKFKQAFFEDLKVLRVEPAEHYPAATDHIPEMITLIETLLAKGVAYRGDDGSVYYAINKFPEYGKLAKINLAGQRSGVRIKNDEYAKDDVADFALWKKWDAADGEVAWDSPWGRGRPGWHIECSAMSMKFLGNCFDLHTGGVDNMFPHHEDEIAQSEAATGCQFVNYWLHCEHLIVNGQKMSKSMGNFYTLRDLLDKGYAGREIRYLLLSAQYRQKLNFTFEALEAARHVLRRFDDFQRRLEEVASGPERGTAEAQAALAGPTAAFRAGLENDLNTPEALASLFDAMREINKLLDAGQLGGAGLAPVRAFLAQADSVLGILTPDRPADEAVPAAITALVEARQAARKARDFALADRLRQQLTDAGWRLEDTPKGPRVVPAK